MAERPTTVPRWADGDEASVVEPAESKKTIGWEAAEKPPAAYFNWLFKLITQWIAWLAERIDAGTGLRLSFKGINSVATAGSPGPGVQGTGYSAAGVRGIGVLGFPGVRGDAGAGASGVEGRGGTASDTGVRGLGGDEGGVGVQGEGGAAGGTGVRGVGGADGDGVVAVAGETASGSPAAVRATGATFGVHATIDGSSGSGTAVVGIAKTTTRRGGWFRSEAAGDALYGEATGAGVGVRAEASGSGPPFLIVGKAAAPTTALADGVIYYDTTLKKFRGRANGAWVDLHA